MSQEQCNRCLYRDALVAGDFAGHYCPVREGFAEDSGGCQDFEHDDDRWDAAGTGGDA